MARVASRLVSCDMTELTLSCSQSLDQLNLSRVIHRMAGNAEHEVERLDLRVGGSGSAGGEVRNRAFQLLLLSGHEVENARPAQHRLVGESKPILSLEGKGLLLTR